ncbi:MAG: porin [Saprospiraceae bacterium]
MKVYLLTIIAILHCIAIRAQNDRISNLPFYDFGKGLGITTPDSLYQLNIRFRMQSRVTYGNKSDAAYIEGQIRRLRLRFDGFVGRPNIMYVIQLSFSPGDVGVTTEGDNLNVIRDAVVFYAPSERWNFGFGQTKLPGNRQRVNSSSALQLTDRSINNAVFNIDRDFGIFMNYINETTSSFSWNIKTAISTGDGRNFTRDPDNGLAYTGKIELLPFGSFIQNGVYFEGDIKREKRLKLMVSGVYHFNDKAKRAYGVFGNDLSSKKDLTSIFVDILTKYKGFALMSTYFSRSTDNPSDQNGNNVFVGHGWDAQSSYINKYNLEYIARYSFQKSASKTSTFNSKKQFTMGLTKYIREHIFKLQLEGGVEVTTNHDNSRQSAPMARFQLEIGI